MAKKIRIYLTGKLNKIFLTISIILISNSWNSAFAIEQKLSFAVSGIISDITVRPGQTVTAGTVLARLDLTQFKAKKKAFDPKIVYEGTPNPTKL